MSDLQPPHDEHAEQAALGGMLLSRNALADVAALTDAADFYRPAHAAVYAAALALHHAGQPADPVTVADELERRGELARVGGRAGLHTLVQAVPTATSAAYYAEIVAAKATRRRLIETGGRIAQLGYSTPDDTDPADTVERARAWLDQLATTAQRSGSVDDVVELADLLPAALTEFEQPAAAGIPTGYHDLDSVLNGGLHPGTLTVVGARPGVGKSILALRIAAHAASLGHGALLFSLEMSRQELMARFFAAEGRIELTTLNKHQLAADDWRRALEVRERAQTWPLAVSEAPRIGITGITARCRDRQRTPRGLAVAVVDYLQLLTPADPKMPREQQIGAISRGLKLLSRELGIAVVAAAQVNRGAADRKPAMSDLRESGSIEADADTVLLLHDDPDPETAGQIEVIVAKNRHGPRVSIQLSWAPHYATARSMAPTHAA